MHPRLRRAGQQAANVVVKPHVGCGVGARSFTDWGVVDFQDPTDGVVTFEAIVGTDTTVVAREPFTQSIVEDMLDQCTFTRAGDASNGNKGVEWEPYINIFQIVLPGAV